MVIESEVSKGKIEHTNPADLLRDLGILTDDPKRAENELKGLKGSFNWVNVATTDIPINRVVRAVYASAVFNPPRTAHLGGSWKRIVQGGSGLVFNRVIMQKGIGYPLIFDFNQTPKNDLLGGDNLYFPGTVLDESGNVRTLPLYNVSGDFLDRSIPRFVPCLLAEDTDGVIKPLTLIHRERMRTIGLEEAGAKFISDILVQDPEKVKGIFRTIFTQISKEDNLAERNRLLKIIVDRGVITNDGRVVDSPLKVTWDGKNYQLGSVTYSTAEEVVSAIMQTFLVAAEPNYYLNSGLPEYLPLISKEMLVVLMAVLDTDFYPGNDSLRPVNPHLHWGAFQMAGAPPKFDGYFSGSAATIRNIMSILRAGDQNIPPIYYVLLPAAPFILWPSEGDIDGQKAMAALIETVHERTGAFKGKPDNIIKGVNQAIGEWRENFDLPPYMIDRFSSYKTPISAALPPSPTMVEPEGFDRLTWRQASTLVGFLLEIYRNQ